MTSAGIVGPATWDALYRVYRGIEGNIGVPPTPAPPAAVSPPFPGTVLRTGSRGESVRLMQQYLNTISNYYTSIPKLVADGIFGPMTEGAVMTFQRIFGLTADGLIGPLTWARIVDEFNLVSTTGAPPPAYPGTPLRVGSRGTNVSLMQTYLNAISVFNPSIPRLVVDGVFGNATAAAVRAFQTIFGLTADGIIGPFTWNRIVQEYRSIS